MTGESLDHLYVARVELTHRTPLLVREGWTEVVQESAAVGNVPPGLECEEANEPLSPATRFLWHLEEDLFPLHFDFTVDSDRDYLFPHSPSQTIAHTLRLGDLQPSFTIRIASSDQVQRQQQRDEPVRENTHLVLDTLASRLRRYHVWVESLVFWVIRTQLIYIQSIVCMSGWNYQ